ncbi:MAG: hypothetical protein J2O49_08905, partial [Sciscionella sp.]|nr:hypothetical protein [Sciscionella sp.]
FGTLASAAKMIAHAGDPKRVGAEVTDTIEQVLQRLRVTSEAQANEPRSQGTGEQGASDRCVSDRSAPLPSPRAADKRAKRSA